MRKIVAERPVRLMEIENLNLSSGKRIAILGIGNELRGDDAAAIEVIKGIQAEIDSENILAINGESVPEKFTSKIKDFNPDQVLLIDTVDFGEEAGFVSKVEPDRIQRDFTSTHRISLDMLIEYLGGETEAEIFLIGIQPARIERGAQISEEVEKSIKELTRFLMEELE